MYLLTIVVCFLIIIALELTYTQYLQFENARFEEARLLSGYVLSDRQSRSSFSCIGDCLHNPECSAVRFTRSHRHCQLFSDVLWLHGSEIPPPDPDVVEYKKVNCWSTFKLCLLRNLKTRCDFTYTHIINKLKRCTNKECCKQCRHVIFKGTMTKWPVQKLARGTKQKLLQHHDATDI